jgi:pseudoazurin
MSIKHLALAAVLAASTQSPALAADHQILLKNQGPGGALMVFQPAFLAIAPGDTVHFVPTDLGHDVQSIPGMIPAGATPLKGEPSKPYDVKLTTPGLYGVRCRPHYAMGMVAVIVVGGKPANLDQARAVAVPGMAKPRIDALLAQAASVTSARKKHA